VPQKKSHEADAEASARNDALVVAATGVFLRYGFKKTSMDDLARAAGLSRQGLYLHFDSKETLFKASVLRLVGELRVAWQAALDRQGVSVEERIIGAFHAVHGMAIAEDGVGAHMTELFETAQALVGHCVDDVERELTAGVALVLESSGIAACWGGSGLSAMDLAEHLQATSAGLKHSAKTAAVYRKSMRTALTIVMRGRTGLAG
jgi:AcrR family transcriptional regulator